MECWMLRAVRLLHSNNSDDYSKIYQMLQDSLDPESESKVYKMTAKEAIQDVSTKSSTKASDAGRKVKNIETVNQITTPPVPKTVTKRTFPYKEVPEETEKKKIQLLNVDLFGPSSISGYDIKRRRNVSSSIPPITKDRITAQESILTSDMLNGGVIQEFTDLHCQICHSLTVSADNMIIECQKCRNLYHQKCHQPHVSQSSAVQLNWHCSKCIDSDDIQESGTTTDKTFAPIDLTVSNLPLNI